MSPDGYPEPIAISRISEDETSRESQNRRAIKWLLERDGGPVVLITPRKDVGSQALLKLADHPLVTHQTWRGFATSSLSNRRVVHAWPDRQHLNDLWGCGADAIAIIEWNKQETAEWIAAARPVQLLADRTVQPADETEHEMMNEPLPGDVGEILEYVADMAAGYSSGLKWNEEDKLKADMMNRPERWARVTVEQVRVKCRELGMRPNDVDTVAGFLQRRKDGRRFNVQSSYRTFQFN